MLVIFTDKVINSPLEHSLSKPFIAINPQYLDKVDQVEEGIFSCQVGATLNKIKIHCSDNDLQFPFCLKEDLDKPIWKVINENSLSLVSLLNNMTKTEAMLTNGQRLFSSPDDPVASQEFDLKKILLVENENISFIHKIQLQFLKKSSSVIRKINFESDLTGQNARELTNYLSNFMDEWKEETKVNLVHYKQGMGREAELYLKFSSNNSHKLRLLDHQMGEIDQKMKNLYPWVHIIERKYNKKMDDKNDQEIASKINEPTKYNENDSIVLTFKGEKNNLMTGFVNLYDYSKKVVSNEVIKEEGMKISTVFDKVTWFQSLKFLT